MRHRHGVLGGDAQRGGDELLAVSVDVLEDALDPGGERAAGDVAEVALQLEQRPPSVRVVGAQAAAGQRARRLRRLPPLVVSQILEGVSGLDLIGLLSPLPSSSARARVESWEEDEEEEEEVVLRLMVLRKDQYS